MMASGMSLKATLGVSLLLLLLNSASSVRHQLTPNSGSGSGTDSPDPPTCDSHSLTLDVSPFDKIIESLQELNCRVSEEGYEVLFKSSDVDLEILESDKSAIFGDYFDKDDDIELEVCTYDILEADEYCCSEELLSVSVTIVSYTDRLLPFAGSFADGSITNADDRAEAVLLSNPIPFWGSSYTSVYLSTNGVVSFGRPFTQYWPEAFPFGQSSVPIVAPYWNDLDFRNNIEDSGLYYTTYTSSGTKRDEAFLQEFSDKISAYTDGGTNFNPTWMLVGTWYKATPFTGMSNSDETLTFQVLVASDSVETYVVFLYEEGGINWNRDSRNIVIGYDAKDYVHYLNVDNSESFTEIDTVTGNTGKAGEWYFQVIDPDLDLDPEQECFKWVGQQEEDTIEEYFAGLPSCPCTQSQAKNDWRFWFGWSWGLSSGPNCATLVWSGRQSTVECCYDEGTGALLVGGTTGGSYRLHHPLFSHEDYVTEDQQPFKHCCQSSKLCSFFYTYRPSDDCSGYDPSKISFTWGDPHFQTVDGLTYTFNGLGEYTLLQSDANDLTIQTRLVPVDTTTGLDGTVIKAVVVVHGAVQPVQVEQGSDGMLLYVDGTAVDAPENENEGLIITESETYDSITEFSSSAESSAEYISLRTIDENLIILTSSGASVMVSSSSSILHLSVEVNDAFINSTKGLLGYLNGDPSDDFYRPDGTVLSSDSTESDIYDYGLLWHVGEEMSKFEYFDGNTYSTYNGGWDMHMPTFTDDLDTSILDDVEATCGDDTACIFDYAVTNDTNFAVATHTISMANEETQNTLSNTAPTITGPMVAYVTSGQIFEETYTVDDADGHEIVVFELNQTLDIITLERSGDTATLVWDSPGSELPAIAIRLVANDSMGASTLHTISIVLCACENNGTCNNATTPQYNDNGHFLQECLCGELFSGILCENDDRGCSNDPCPEFAVCVEDSSVDVGYNCSSCQDGYELTEDGKCNDINECDTDEHGCMHTCNNTEGSYECLCDNGYELMEDGRNCTDIDECYRGTDDCETQERCVNTEGSYECDCYYPHTPTDSGCLFSTCVSFGSNPCDQGTACADVGGDQGVCLCSIIGAYCVGDCNGTFTALESGNQSCEPCTDNHYGYRCKKTCDCENGECDPISGCVCDAGYTGNHCESEVNEAAPEFVNNTIKALTLSWNLPEGAVLAQFNATDMDVGPPGELIYSLYHGYHLPATVSSGEGIFSIDNETGVLVLVQDLNTTRDLYERFVLTVMVTDLGRDPRSSDVIVPVTLEDTPAPIPSFDKGLYAVKISENVPGDSNVLNFSCTEPKEATGTSNLTTGLAESNDSQLFSLDGEYDDLMLVLLKQRDYETLEDTTVPHYTLEVTCSNQYDITATATIEIEVLNENDNNFEFENSTYSVTVPEDVGRYHHVLSVSAFDPDIPDGIITYDAIKPGKFSIFPNGTVYVTDSLDREEKDKYTLSIEAMLSSSREITEAVVNITISDINEGPPIFSNDLYTSDNLTTANTVGDVAVAVAAVDRDFENNGSVVYSIESNTLFAINSVTGEVYINHADVVSSYGSHVLEVYATDEGDPPMNSTSRVDIYISPIPDRIEFTDTPSTVTIREDSPRGHEIETVSANVLDQNGGVIRDAVTVGDVEYELMLTDDSEHFHIGRYSGKLILLNSLDFETVKSYNLTIIASIPNYLKATVQSTATIEVLVSDVNDNAPVFTPSFYTEVVEEFTHVGVSILTVHAADADSDNNAVVSYRLADSVDVPFSVDSMNGVIQVTSSLDTPQDYRFHVVAEDGGTPRHSSETVVFISVVRSLSLVPEFDREQYTFTVEENSPAGTEIGTVRAQLAGNSSISEYAHLNLQYRLQSQDPDVVEMFHIDPDLGVASVLSALDAEQQNLYFVHVEVFNGSHVFDSASIEVHVEDVNDHAPEFSQSLYTDVITTAEPQGSLLFTVLAEDGDEPESENSLIQYTIDESGTIGFGINHTTGAVYVVNSTLYAGDYHLTAVATDGGEPRMNGTVVVFISVIPADPQSILFEESEYIFNVSEDAGPGTPVGRVVALDHNRAPFPEGTDLSYHFSAETPTDLVHLTIGQQSGEILVSGSLDRESQPSYTLTVIAEYEGNQTGEVIMIVNILDINDNSPIFTKDVYAESIFTTHGTLSAILQVSASDRDTDLNGKVNYTFSGGESENNQFRITETGEIYSLTETIPAGEYRMIVTASDSNPTMPEISTAIVSISVVYQEPAGTLQVTETTFEIEENVQVGTVIGTIQLESGGIAIVPEHYEGNLEFSIGGDHFVINPSNGTMKVVGLLDYEQQGSYSFEVTASFIEYNIHITENITIEVVDDNDNSPVFNPILYSTIIDDGYTDNQPLPTDEVLVTDRDSGSNAELNISLDATNPFGIHVISNSEGEFHGEIIVQNASLLMPGETYFFNITASDGGDPPQTSMAVVHIQVRYAIPETIYFPYAHYAFNYTENSPKETVVGRVSVLPETPALDDLVYSVSGGLGLFVFHVDQYSGEISNHFPLDREHEDEYNLTITANLIHHPISLSASTSVTVTILDTNDNIPIFDRSSYSTVVYLDELVTDVPIITVSASDSDAGKNSEINYSIDLTENFIIMENGSIFATTASLDVDTYSLSVEATDMGDVPQTGRTIVLIDIRQSLPDPITFSEDQYVFNISEYTISGTRVGEVVLDPPLPPEFVQYRSFSSVSDDFAVVTQSGVVQSRQQFDYDAGETHIEFEVTCTLHLPHESPPVTLTATAAVRVNILDENDNTPRFVDFPTNLEYPENVAPEELLTTISAEDADSGRNAKLVFSIVNDALLRIDPNTGEIFVRPGLDREQQAVHTVSVNVSDRGSDPNSYQDDFTLTLLDINDNAPVLVQSEFSVDERVSGRAVFRLDYRDPDEGENGTAIFQQPSSEIDTRFIVDNTSGEVTVTEPLDFETEQSVQLYIELVDNPGNPSVSNHAEYEVTVNILDKPDNPPEFASSLETTIIIDPGITEGDRLTQVFATDKDDDDITFTIVTSADFNNIQINPTTGEINFTQSTTLDPGAEYSVTVEATDNSRYELTSTIELIIRIDALGLAFEQEAYSSSIAEDADINTNVSQLIIQGLARSDFYEYSFSYEIISPSGVPDPFTSSAGQYQIDIIVDDDDKLDRETVSSYVLEVTATRYPIDDPSNVESVTVDLTITIEDVNDNIPVISPPQSMYYIPEDTAISTEVIQVTATDSDIGINSVLRYFIISPATSPFVIDQNDGSIIVGQKLDFESQETYTLTVKVEDLGTPTNFSTADYRIQILNENDETPYFAAPAYFGELYTLAPANSEVKHVLLEVSDRDGDDVIFSISPDPSDVSAEDYTLSVESQPPYHVTANRIPSNAQSGLRKFIIEVSDNKHTNSTILYLGVFSQEHLLPMTVSGKSKENFLSVHVSTVLSNLSSALSIAIGQPVSYYYESIDESNRDTTVLIMNVYGWYGGYGTRYNNGKEETRELSNSVNYVTYNGVEEGKIARAVSDAASNAGFDIVVGDVPVSSPTAEPPTASTGDTLTVGIISGAVVAVLLIILLIVAITVFGRRRNPKKPEKDLYSDLSYKRRRRAKGSESFGLTRKGSNSDLAYETMFDEDDDMLNQEQTMPWFDPNYLASKENEDYDGDGEQSSFKGGRLRATVDGDAKRPHRDLTDSAAEQESVMELDRSKYLDSYQQSTPMQPGQRMGEYDMFLNRNAQEAERSRRPSLDNMAGLHGHGMPAVNHTTPVHTNSHNIPPAVHANSRNMPPAVHANSRNMPPSVHANSRSTQPAHVNSRNMPQARMNSRSAQPVGKNSRGAPPAAVNSRGIAVNSRGIAKTAGDAHF